MCQCGNKSNCGCTPKDYTSGLVYDGQNFNAPGLTAIKGNCTNLNDLLESLDGVLATLLNGVLTLDIGAWDMDTVNQVLIPHNLSNTEFNSVVGLSALITDDANSLKIALGGFGTGGSNGSISIDATNVILDRTAGDIFDSAAFSGAVSNRGKIIINYTKD